MSVPVHFFLRPLTAPISLSLSNTVQVFASPKHLCYLYTYGVILQPTTAHSSPQITFTDVITSFLAKGNSLTLYPSSTIKHGMLTRSSTYDTHD
ncbi:hypothetical protein GGU10DRAFT_73930 [Lentinula aff. detonsa]|uniref:Uncharacterized protein n=1 Tax=Lentinula aff. detonsa TaxID=2804958 RepID=A0AA38NI25_9AGAR|nr:hypothetical protein GGU10DRAFT_73930 [Lentinula aff. detonsa]